MVQLWNSLSLIHYKYLKYIAQDYGLILALRYYSVSGKTKQKKNKKNTCPLSQQNPLINLGIRCDTQMVGQEKLEKYAL